MASGTTQRRVVLVTGGMGGLGETYLAFEEAAFVTGANIAINGGPAHAVAPARAVGTSTTRRHE